MNAILGISAYYHDSAAALLLDGEIVAAAQEERFTRIKHDSSFPRHAIEYVLGEAGLSTGDVSEFAFYEKPFLKFERLLETYHAFAPKGLASFYSAIPVWIKEKVFLKKLIRDELEKHGAKDIRLVFPEHHLSHAASAFYPSPFRESAILTIDGVGEWTTTTIGHGTDNSIRMLREIHFPHSLGLLYSAFTYFCGFRVNSGEYKLMGLAPYGNPHSRQYREMKQKIRDMLVDIREDGSFLLNMDYFGFATGLRMIDEKKWENLFGIPRRIPESELSQDYMDLALAIQAVTEEAVIMLANTAKEITGSEHLTLAGGVALNCVANGKILKEGIFRDIWIQPASGDAGGALGAAFAVWYAGRRNTRKPMSNPGGKHTDFMRGAYLGPEFTDTDIQRVARRYSAPFTAYGNFGDACEAAADLLAEGAVIGWFQGRMEYGPRALGNRSILGDPRSPDLQKKLNLKIKYRESFRPFAPAVLEEDIDVFFDLDRPSPYMLLVAPVQEARRSLVPDNYHNLSISERLYYTRSDIQAVTHIDFSARIQSVSRQTNEKFWNLIDTFKRNTGYGLLVNTSFNVRGEPIVCTPEDAYKCFMRTEMDYLVMNNFIFDKKQQEKFADTGNYLETYTLD